MLKITCVLSAGLVRTIVPLTVGFELALRVARNVAMLLPPRAVFDT